MLQSRHIVVADSLKGETETLYQGPSVVEAEKAFQEAIAAGKAQAVVIFHHPVPGRIRYPLQEAQAAKEREEAAKRAAEAQANAATLTAKTKREQAQKLLAEADQLEGKEPEADPGEKGEPKKGKKK